MNLFYFLNESTLIVFCSSKVLSYISAYRDLEIKGKLYCVCVPVQLFHFKVDCRRLLSIVTLHWIDHFQKYM